MVKKAINKGRVNEDAATGEQILWRLPKPVEYEEIDYYRGIYETKKTSFVVTSATYAMFSGPETYIFPADKDGNILSWGELDGSYRGGLNHERAINGLLAYIESE